MKKHIYLFLILSFPALSSAQAPVTGIPPFSSIDAGGFDAVNRQNLNVHISFPIASSPGRGRAFTYPIVYDSLVWQKVNSAWTPVTDSAGVATWGWKKDTPSGSITYTSVNELCDTPVHPTYYRHYLWYKYADMAGVAHDFPVDFYMPNNCNLDPQGPRTGGASDGSGFYLDATNPTSPKVIAASGTVVSGPSMKDTNGNFISAVLVSGAETDWKDTAGHTAVKIIKNGSSIDYKVPSPDGTFQTYTLKLQGYAIRTAFGCSGVTEYNQSDSLPYELDLPNGTKYLFSYEATPGFPSNVTGRLKRVTFPTGGYYEYQYPATPNNGISCTDVGANSLTRVMNDGSTSVQWVYSRAANGSSGWTTTITAPLAPGETAQDQSVYSFNASGQETNRQFYQGSVVPANLVRSVATTWAGITPASNTITLDDGTTGLTETTYDSVGNLLTLKEHDWNSPSTVVRTTAYAYLAGSAYAALNILNRVTQVKITDVNNVVKSRTDIAYDEPAYLNANCPSGATQHDNTNYGCTYTTRGNPTTITTYTDAATPGGSAARHMYYDSLGNLVKADLSCCQQKQWNFSPTTNYSFPDSIVRGPVGTQLTTSATYNANTGQLATSTDENGKVSTLTYDALQRLIDVLRPDNQHVVYAYDDVNRTVKVTSPVQGTDVVRQTTFFDPLGRPFKQQVTDLNNASYSIAETQFDSWGRPYRVSNPHNSTAAYFTETDFDALSRPKTSNLILPNGTVVAGNTTTYAYAGASVTVTDPAGKQKKSKSDGLGRLAQLYEPDASNALTQNTDYTYSVLDGLLTATQGVQTRTYTYDDLGHVKTVKTPESNQVATSFQYDSFGLLTQRTDPRGVISTYSYDGLNRPAGVSYNVGSSGVPATPSVTLAYGTSGANNNNGRLLTVTDGVGTETYTYELLGRVTQLQKVISGTTYTTQYAYNLASELTQITYPSNRVVQQSYDAIGRLCAVAGTSTNCTTYTSPFASGFGYNTAGLVTGFNYGNGVAASLGYTSDTLQLQSLSYAKSGTTLLSLNYYYKQDSTNCPNAPTGNDGQIQCIKDLTGMQEAGRSVTYTYDGLNRLATAVTAGSTGYPQWGLSWTYDRYGNRTNQTQTAGGPPMNSVTVDPNTNRITGSPYAYDANGNMTNDGNNTLVYDAENRVVSATNGGASGTYTYDGNGLRVKKVSGSTTTVYIFSGSKVIAEYVNGAAATTPTREYVYSGSALLAKIESGATNYYHPDHLSPRLLTDSSGASAGQRGHYPYGETWYETGTTTKIKFTTYERDAESGNDFAMARYHVNRLGRFSGPDALGGSPGNPQSLNRYAYVQNDPVNLVDPSGLYIEVLCYPGFQLHDSSEKPKTYTLWSCTWSQITGVRIYSYWDLMRNWRDMHPPDIGPPNLPAPPPLLPVAPPPPPCDSRNGRPFDIQDHPAIDVSTPGLGSPVYALEGGTVTGENAGGKRVPPPYDFSKPASAGVTNFVLVTAGGYTDQYFHVTPSPLAPLGAAVATGSLIGITDNTGRQIGPPGHHYHLQVRGPNGNLIDPRTHLPCI